MQRSTEPGPASEPLAFASKWANKAEMPHFSPLPGVTMYVYSGGRAMMNYIEIAPGGTVPWHRHPHEQMGTVFEGEIRLTVGTEDAEPWVLRRGDFYSIAPNVPHAGVVGDEGCIVLDIFAPPRADYIAQANAGANSAAGTYLTGTPPASQ